MFSSHDPSDEESEKWHYEYKPPSPKPSFNWGLLIWDCIRHALSYGAFTALPLLFFIALDWILFFSFKDTYFNEPWMVPIALVVSVFLSGAFARQLMEEYIRSMGLFVVGVLGLCTFALIVYYDVTHTGSFFSASYMPQILRLIILPYVYATPVVGLVGMLFYKLFSLRP